MSDQVYGTVLRKEVRHRLVLRAQRFIEFHVQVPNDNGVPEALQGLLKIRQVFQCLGWQLRSDKHRWDLPVLSYHEIMVIYPYPFLVVIIQLFSWIIFLMTVYENWFICIIYINDHIFYIKNGGNKNAPDSLNVMVNYHYHSENRVITW